MAYWWVAQNKTYSYQIPGGYLWSPLPDQDGNPYHWATMGRVSPGDVIFSYVHQQIYSIGVASSNAYTSGPPDPVSAESGWNIKGWRVDVKFQEPPKKVHVPKLVRQLLPLLPKKYSPLTRYGSGNQGYLFPLTSRAAQLLLAVAGVKDSLDYQNYIVDCILRSNDTPTVREALVLSRVGQGQFRRDLINLWSGKCCITGLSVESLLKVSHIKPWRDCNNLERLDPYNGLLLSPAYDAAFDKGFITFSDEGHIKISSRITEEQLCQLGIDTNTRIPGIQEQHKVYLKYHRQEVFSA